MKMKKIIIVVIALIGVFLIGTSVFLIINKDNKVEVNEKNDSLEDSDVKYVFDARELTQDEQNELLGKIEKYNYGLGHLYPITDISTVSNSDLFLLSYKEARIPDKNLYDANKIDEFIENHFDDNIKLKHEDYLCLVDKKVLFKYDSSNKTYSFVYDGHPHGGSQRGGVASFDVKVLDTQFKDDIYTINTKVLYGQSCSDVCGPNSVYYRSYEDSMKNINEIARGFSETITESEKDGYREVLPITTYKFKKNSKGNIVLISVEIN